MKDKRDKRNRKGDKTRREKNEKQKTANTIEGGKQHMTKSRKKERYKMQATEYKSRIN